MAREVADMTGETKTEAIRRALAERRERLGAPTLGVGEDFSKTGLELA